MWDTNSAQQNMFWLEMMKNNGQENKMKFCKLITEVDVELLEWLWERGYPVELIVEGEFVYFKTPALLCENLTMNDDVKHYSNGLIRMEIENVQKKRGLYKSDDLLIDVESNMIYRGEEKILVPKSSFALIQALINAPHKTVSRATLLFNLEQIYNHDILDNTLTVHIALIRRLIGNKYIGTHKTVGYYWKFDVIKVG